MPLNPYRRWLYLLAAPPLVLAGLILWMTLRMSSEADWAEHRSNLIRVIADTQNLLVDAETGQRGFIITGDDSYLQPYLQARKEFPDQLNQLKSLTAGSGSAQASLAELERISASKFRELELTIRLRRDQGLEAAAAHVKLGIGQEYMNQIRATLSGMDSASTATLQAALDKRKHTSTALFVITGLGVFVTGIGLIALYRLGAEDEADRSRTETKELKDLNQNLEEFAQVAAHDLRSPTRSVLSMIQLARRQMDLKPASEPSRLLDLAEESLRRQMEMVDSLLTYHRATHAELPPPAAVPIGVPVKRALDNLDSLIERTSTAIHQRDLPVVLGHEDQLTLLFQNLIENAIKYRRPEQSPKVDIVAAQQGAEWLITVRDNGQGFEPEYREKIFRPFERLQGSNQSGSGIGLATCAKIIERHGGRMWATSEVGHGSEFFIVLPDAQLAAEAGQDDIPSSS